MNKSIYKKRTQRIRKKLKKVNSDRPRLTVFRSSRNISAQIIDDKNNIQTNEFDSISTGITHQFNSQLRSTLGYGYMKAKDNNDFARIQKDNPNQNKELWQGWINAMYNPYKPITLGMEYVYGERETFDGRSGTDNRINMMASYDF